MFIIDLGCVVYVGFFIFAREKGLSFQNIVSQECKAVDFTLFRVLTGTCIHIGPAPSV